MSPVTVQHDIPLDLRQVPEFCRKWKVREFALFGSVLRTDFRPDSDVDVLLEFEPDAPWSLLDWVSMREELTFLFGRPVDVVERAAIRNPFRRRSILTSRQVICGV